MYRRIILRWITILLYIVVDHEDCHGKVALHMPYRYAKTVQVSCREPLELQLVSENTIYEINDRINLQGRQITIPSNSELKFKKKGMLVNGSVFGNRTLLLGQLKGIFEDVVIKGSFINKSVSSNIFKTAPNLESLINLVEEDGCVCLDSDIEHDGTPILITKSVSIKGGRHVIKIHSEGIKSGFLFNIKGINSFNLTDVVIDGGFPRDPYQVGRLSGQYNYKWLICAEDCEHVTIENCLVKNLFYQMAHSPDYPYELDDSCILIKQDHDLGQYIQKNMYNLAHFAMISFVFCKEVTMRDNVFENVNAEEGVFFLANNSFVPPVKATIDSKFIATNNRFECKGVFSYTNNRFVPENMSLSSWITVAFGQCEIIGNEFGACHGSQLNAFCSNSVIKNNVFKESKSGSIDLNECGFLGFVPENMTVSDNRAYNTLYFIQTSAGININIEHNVFDCSGVPEGYGSDINMFAFCNRSTNDIYAPLNTFHPISNFTIAHNKSINTLLFFCDWNYGEMEGEKKGLVIDSNIVENRSTYASIAKDGSVKKGLSSDRPSVLMSSFKDVRITNNIIKGTGSPRVSIGNGQRKTPSYITVIQPSKNSFLKDVVIENNHFESEYYNTILLTHLILDSNLNKKGEYRNGIGFSRIMNENNIMLIRSLSE